MEDGRKDRGEEKEREEQKRDGVGQAEREDLQVENSVRSLHGSFCHVLDGVGYQTPTETIKECILSISTHTASIQPYPPLLTVTYPIVSLTAAPIWAGF